MDNIDALIAQADRELSGGDDIDALIAQAEREQGGGMAAGTYTPLPKPGPAPAPPTGIWDTAQSLFRDAQGNTPQQSFDLAMRDEPDAGMLNPAIRTAQGMGQGMQSAAAALGRLPDYSPFAANRREVNTYNVSEDVAGLVHGGMAMLPPVMAFSYLSNTAQELQKPGMPAVGQWTGKGMSAVLDLPAEIVAQLGGPRPDPTKYTDPDDVKRAEVAARMWDNNVLLMTLGVFGGYEQAKAARRDMRGVRTEYDGQTVRTDLPVAGASTTTVGANWQPPRSISMDEALDDAFSRAVEGLPPPPVSTPVGGIAVPPTGYDTTPIVDLDALEAGRRVNRIPAPVEPAPRLPTATPEVPGMIDGNRPQVLEALHQSLIEVGVESVEAARRVARLAPSQRDAIFNDANAWRDWVNQNRATNFRGEPVDTAGRQPQTAAPTGADTTTQPTPTTTAVTPVLQNASQASTQSSNRGATPLPAVEAPKPVESVAPAGTGEAPRPAIDTAGNKLVRYLADSDVSVKDAAAQAIQALGSGKIERVRAVRTMLSSVSLRASDTVSDKLAEIGDLMDRALAEQSPSPAAGKPATPVLAKPTVEAPKPVLANPAAVVDTTGGAGLAADGSQRPNAPSENGPTTVSLTGAEQVGGSLVSEPVQAKPAVPAVLARRRRATPELPPFLQMIVDHGGIMSKKEAIRNGRYEQNKSSYDDVPSLGSPAHNRIYSNGRGGQGKLMPDEVVKYLQMEGVLAEDASVSDLWAKIGRESTGAIKTANQIKAMEAADREQGRLARSESRKADKFQQEAQRPTKQREPVAVNDLVIGSKFKLKGEKFEVVAIDPDTGNVTVKDGPTFGIRELQADQTFFIEKDTLRQPRLSKSAPDVFDEAKAGSPVEPVLSKTLKLESPTEAQLAAEATAKAARDAKADHDAAMTRYNAGLDRLTKATSPEERQAVAEQMKQDMADAKAAKARLAQAQAEAAGTQGDLAGIGGAGKKSAVDATTNAALSGDANTLFSKSAYEEALARVRRGLAGESGSVGGHGATVALSDLITVGGYHLERLARSGVKSFEQWAKAMRAEYGAVDKTQLKAVWKELAQREDVRGLVTHQFVKRIDASAEIDAATKARLTEREYQPIKDATRQAEVQSAAEGLSVEQLAALAKDQNRVMPDDKRMWVSAEAARRLKDEIVAAREMGDAETVRRLAGEQSAVLDVATKVYEEAGRTLRTARMAFPDLLTEMTRETLGDWATKRLQERLRGLTPEQRAMIDKLAADAEAAPAGFQRTEKMAELVRQVDRLRGVSVSSIALDIYYTHIFSGLGTHARNVVDTNLNVLNDAAIMAANQLITGNPAAAGEILLALVRGYGRGLRDAGGVMRTGVAGGTHISQLETQSTLDSLRFKGGAFNPLNYYKYVRRGLGAEDVTAFRAAEEAKAFDVAYRQARQLGLSRGEARQRARSALGLTAEQRAAQLARARAEGLKGNRLSRRALEIREQGRAEDITDPAIEFGRRSTYNADMQGSLAAVGDAIGSLMNKAPVLRLIQPVVRIPINVFNRGLDYTPYGAVRATLGRRGNVLTGEWRERYGGKMTAAERLTTLEKSAVGTLAMAGVAALAAQYMNDENPLFWVHGRGPLDPRQRAQWMNAGGKPYSWKINGQYVSYAYTPLVLPMAALGGILDQMRYNNKKLSMQDAGTQLAAAFTAMSSAIMEQAFLSGLKDFIEGLSDPRASTKRNVLTGIASKFGNIAIPNAVRDVERMIDPQATDARNIPQALTQPVPGLRQKFNPVLTDALGQPVVRPRLKMVEAFTTITTADPVRQLLHQRQLWVPDVSRSRAENQPPLTDDEYYRYRETAGKILNTYLAARRGDLARLPHDQAQDLVQKLADDARKQARMQLGMNNRPQPRLSRVR